MVAIAMRAKTATEAMTHAMSQLFPIIREPPMRRRRAFPFAALALAVAACNPINPGAPLMPGSVNAPPPPIAAPGDALLTNTIWSWKETVTGDDKRIRPEAPERYTLEFQPGGMLIVRADCNRGSASYLLNGGSLSFGPIALTRAMCAPGSMDSEFTRELEAVSGQLFRDAELVLTLRLDSGSMFFRSPRQ
jgi:heat shock protein HslJ